ncbi:flavin reductase family protein [Paenibacillus solani]|uniref:flavin reductase family protein n=1 Tax=Paenibacillus solani TaxID=1705565 RepID=UPI003D284038
MYKEDLVNGLWNLTNSIVLVTTECDGQFNVMTSCSSTPIGDEPPIIALNISKSRLTYELITKSQEFAINILSESQSDIAKICGSYSGRNVDKFKKAHLQTKTPKIINSPLIEECVANLECKLIKIIQYPKPIIIGEVVSSYIDYEKKPLIFFRNQMVTTNTI